MISPLLTLHFIDGGGLNGNDAESLGFHVGPDGLAISSISGKDNKGVMWYFIAQILVQNHLFTDEEHKT